jgi:hypothetical protein
LDRLKGDLFANRNPSLPKARPERKQNKLMNADYDFQFLKLYDQAAERLTGLKITRDGALGPAATDEHLRIWHSMAETALSRTAKLYEFVAAQRPGDTARLTGHITELKGELVGGLRAIQELSPEMAGETFRRLVAVLRNRTALSLVVAASAAAAVVGSSLRAEAKETANPGQPNAALDVATRLANPTARRCTPG